MFAMWEDLVGASHVDDGLAVVSSGSPVSLFVTAFLGISFQLRLLSSQDLVTVCSHHYSPHFLVPQGLVILNQLCDVAANALEIFSRHWVGGWRFQGLKGLVSTG